VCANAREREAALLRLAFQLIVVGSSLGEWRDAGRTSKGRSAAEEEIELKIEN
jgi:hypothetical protein